ncbi:hypothetical protein Q427_12050 [Halomonas sp. BC04]|nr:hypothetical protein Q427_12050 [Halomonas sp. BC04]
MRPKTTATKATVLKNRPLATLPRTMMGTALAGFNTGGVPIAVNCSGFVPFTMMAAEDGSFGYEMEIITYPDSGIETVEDLTGRNLAFTSETSNSGYRARSCA